MTAPTARPPLPRTLASLAAQGLVGTQAGAGQRCAAPWRVGSRGRPVGRTWSPTAETHPWACGPAAPAPASRFSSSLTFPARRCQHGHTRDQITSEHVARLESSQGPARSTASRLRRAAPWGRGRPGHGGWLARQHVSSSDPSLQTVKSHTPASRRDTGFSVMRCRCENPRHTADCFEGLRGRLHCGEVCHRLCFPAGGSDEHTKVTSTKGTVGAGGTRLKFPVNWELH